MTKKSTTPIQTPGASPAAAAENTGSVAGEGTPTESAPAAVVEAMPDTGETVTVSKSELATMMAKMDALSDKVKHLESAPAAAVVKRANPDAHLPDQDSIDPANLKSPVLTRQGWVVPESFGSQAAKKA